MSPGLLPAAGVAALAVAATVALHVALNCPIDPLPSPRQPPSPHPPNNLLQKVEKLGEGRLIGPEDVHVVAAAGDAAAVYTATRDGWLQRMHPNGSWERWRFVGGDGLLGIFPSVDGGMLVCDADKGLLKVREDEVQGSKIGLGTPTPWRRPPTARSTSATSAPGSPSTAGSSDSSRPTRPAASSSMTPSPARPPLRSTASASPMASPSPRTCDTLWFRCVKLWLKGDEAGQSETLVDNLPGCPDNIRLAPDGTFWIALQQLSSPLLDLATGWTIGKRILASFPALVERAKAGLRAQAMVAQVSQNGGIITVLDDSEGKVMGLVTSVTEFNGDLYIGSLAAYFVGKLSLAHLRSQGQSEE